MLGTKACPALWYNISCCRKQTLWWRGCCWNTQKGLCQCWIACCLFLPPQQWIFLLGQGMFSKICTSALLGSSAAPHPLHHWRWCSQYVVKERCSPFGMCYWVVLCLCGGSIFTYVGLPRFLFGLCLDIQVETQIVLAILFWSVLSHALGITWLVQSQKLNSEWTS